MGEELTEARVSSSTDIAGQPAANDLESGQSIGNRGAHWSHRAGARLTEDMYKRSHFEQKQNS